MTSRPATPPKAPPPAPTSRSVVLEQRIDLEQLRRITIEDGDVLVLPADFPQETAEALGEALVQVKPGLKCLVVVGDVRRLDVSEMNRMGWYRA
ncbi:MULTISPECIES: hypothetical protein [Pseudomonas]|uniref:hypothetical protein n=1 Tax=Pseudomonas TaxID=286 RepID=UPI0021F20B57|nr:MULTISPECIES: hypothetical protein [Pseudomonas]MCV6429365.1 hypothetical protein [Pseudomonas aeruginosa]MCV6437403.1 hypothetical protein [Pseudomonas aeruginosa]MDU4251455.1 hypothetical protein [Pseudomonas sp.]